MNGEVSYWRLEVAGARRERLPRSGPAGQRHAASPARPQVFHTVAILCEHPTPGGAFTAAKSAREPASRRGTSLAARDRCATHFQAEDGVKVCHTRLHAHGA